MSEAGVWIVAGIGSAAVVALYVWAYRSAMRRERHEDETLPAAWRAPREDTKGRAA